MLEDSYLKLPYDLSGSMSKNRFRNEMLWDLKRCLNYIKRIRIFLWYLTMCAILRLTWMEK